MPNNELRKVKVLNKAFIPSNSSKPNFPIFLLRIETIEQLTAKGYRFQDLGPSTFQDENDLATFLEQVKGDPGNPGKDGDSFYKLAVKKGITVKSETEFLNDMLNHNKLTGINSDDNYYHITKTEYDKFKNYENLIQQLEDEITALEGTPQPITEIININGLSLTAPVATAASTNATTTDANYTVISTVWDNGIVVPNPFDYDTVYISTVVLKAKVGFKFAQLLADATHVIDADIEKNTLTITATYPKTNSAPILDIPDTDGLILASPVRNIPSTNASTTDTEYDVISTTWDNGLVVPAPFAADTVYTSVVVLKAKAGYKFPASLADANSIIDADIEENTLTITTVYTVTGSIPAVPPTEITSIAGLSIVAPMALANSTNATTTDTDYTIESTAWNNGITIPDPFNYDIVYTSVIVIKANAGYKFASTLADATHVINADVEENSITITIVHPKTGVAPITEITNISGFTLLAPVKDVISTNASTNDTEYDVISTTWDNGLVPPAMFAADTVYTSTAVLKAKVGYKFAQSLADATHVINDDVEENTLTITNTYPKTDANIPTVTEITSISGLSLTAPVALVNSENASTTDTDYTIISTTWDNGINVSDPFDYDTVYTATVVIKSNAGYKFASALADATHVIDVDDEENTMTITLVFSVTAARPIISITDILGLSLNAPVATESAVNAVTTDTNYIIQSTLWDNGINIGDEFDYDTVYTAIVVIKANYGFKFDASLASPNHIINADTEENELAYTIVFAKTEEQPAVPPPLTVISTLNINLTAPVTGDTAANATTTDGTYAIQSTVWNNGINIGDVFIKETVYNATVTVKSNTNHKFDTIINSSNININAGTVSNVVVSGDIERNTITFDVGYPATLDPIITIDAVTLDLASPVTDVASTDALDTTQYEVISTSWDNGIVVPALFDEKTVYTVTMELKAKAGYKFNENISTIASTDGTVASNIAVSDNNEENILTFNIVFVETAERPVTIVDLTSAVVNIVAPVKDVNSAGAIAGDLNYTVTNTSWNNGLTIDQPFAADTVYVATIAVQANTGHKFSSTMTAVNVASNNGSISDFNIVGNAEGNSITFKLTFPKTDANAPVITEITNVNGLSLTAPVATAASENATTTDSNYTIISTIWDNGINIGDPFAYNTIYTATVILESNAGYKFVQSLADATHVIDADIEKNTLTITITYPKTAVYVPPVDSIGSIAGLTLTAPVALATSEDAVTTDTDYTVESTTWNNGLTVGDPFAYNTIYSATVVLKAVAGKKFPSAMADTTHIINADVAENTMTILMTFTRTELDPSAPDMDNWVFEFRFDPAATLPSAGNPFINLTDYGFDPNIMRLLDTDVDGPNYDGVDSKVKLYVSSTASQGVWQDPGVEIPNRNVCTPAEYIPVGAQLGNDGLGYGYKFFNIEYDHATEVTPGDPDTLYNIIEIRLGSTDVYTRTFRLVKVSQ